MEEEGEPELEERPKDALVMQYKGSGKPVVIPRQDLTLTVDPEVFDQFLSHVARGERKQAEKMLKEESHFLGCFSGRVTDLSGRIFEDISALALALWNLDIDMCVLLLRYLSPNIAGKQAMQCKTKTGRWIAMQGEHAGALFRKFDSEPWAFRTALSIFWAFSVAGRLEEAL